MLDRRKTVILPMDFQNRMLNELSDEARKEILKKVNDILTKARQLGIPVVYVKNLRGEKTPETEIHIDLAPKLGELVLIKKRTGPFTTTNLNEILKQLGVDTIILMGIATFGCVLTTVRCAADMDYKLVVVSDCCANPPDAEIHRILMEKIFPTQASVMTCQELLEELA